MWLITKREASKCSALHVPSLKIRDALSLLLYLSRGIFYKGVLKLKFQEWTFSKIIPFLVCFLTSIPQNYPVGIHSAVLQTTLIGPTAAISIDSAEGHRESLPLKPSWWTRAAPPVCLILLPQGLASHAYAADTWASLFKRSWSTFSSRAEISARYWCALPRCWKAGHLHFSGTYKLQPRSVRRWRISSPLLPKQSSTTFQLS